MHASPICRGRAYKYPPFLILWSIVLLDLSMFKWCFLFYSYIVLGMVFVLRDDICNKRRGFFWVCGYDVLIHCGRCVNTLWAHILWWNHWIATILFTWTATRSSRSLSSAPCSIRPLRICFRSLHYYLMKGRLTFFDFLNQKMFTYFKNVTS